MTTTDPVDLCAVASLLSMRAEYLAGLADLRPAKAPRYRALAARLEERAQAFLALASTTFLN